MLYLSSGQVTQDTTQFTPLSSVWKTVDPKVIPRITYTPSFPLFTCLLIFGFPFFLVAVVVDFLT